MNNEEKPMPAVYEIEPHADGYVVIRRGAARGISTHADIADAIAECRAANRYARALAK